MMILTIATWKIKKGHEEASEKVLRKYVSRVESEKGTLAYAIYRKIGEPNSYVAVERYKDAAAQKAHMEQPYRKDLEPIFPMFDGGLNVLGDYEEVAAINEKRA
jgi:quinol monooxygenase YgiN